ncbi:protein UXT-like isoform X3 [Neodiprion fabricii]|uniref:protein UXT-like isoform X3 n=1 Tax=Neodiprion fabricii TaxID=2872261 RepID=UPI001ED9250F|nr:protein UXT-like isoform X3 [Neodiprion fabricii]XP_046434045.1 protein UXT-like isoform X3 [Neodiprion fabricii]XP_046434046.1 protein UXT-like isoform X3 [Neodiprion fabricii]
MPKSGPWPSGRRLDSSTVVVTTTIATVPRPARQPVARPISLRHLTLDHHPPRLTLVSSIPSTPTSSTGYHRVRTAPLNARPRSPVSPRMIARRCTRNWTKDGGLKTSKEMDPFIAKKVVQFETYVNEVLREDLRKLESKLNEKNVETAEYLQLKSTISALQSMPSEANNGFKTKLDMGNNFYVQAVIEDSSMILLDVGLGHFVEFTLDEAVVVINLRLKLLDRQVKNLREESAKTKAHIKLILMSIMELQGMK